MKDRSFRRTVVFDEKWFREDKNGKDVIELGPDSDPEDEELHKGRKSKTQTQMIKVMYLVAATEQGVIGLYEIDFASEDNVTKKGTKGRGMTTALLKPIIDKMLADARKVLGDGLIAAWFYRAPTHMALVTYMKQIFDEVVVQPPRSPDLNMEDAALFPYMERKQQEAGGLSKAQIKASTELAYSKITPEICRRACAAVRRNINHVITLHGGNLYNEHAKKLGELHPDEPHHASEYCHEFEDGSRGLWAMILCDTCECGVHVKCAGLKKVPAGEWHCMDCE